MTGSRARSASTSACGSASWPGRRRSSGRTTCPRPGPERSCDGCCATSPRDGISGTSPAWAIRPSCTSCRKRSRPTVAAGSRSVSDSVLVVWGDELLTYDLGATHPMAPGRLEFTMALARDLGVLDRPNVRLRAPTMASDDLLTLLHHPDYLAAVREAPKHPSADWLADFGLGGHDNPVFDGMHEASAVVTGATVEAARAVRTGEAQHAVNLAGGLHHAMPSRASGFC